MFPIRVKFTCVGRHLTSTPQGGEVSCHNPWIQQPWNIIIFLNLPFPTTNQDSSSSEGIWRYKSRNSSHTGAGREAPFDQMLAHSPENIQAASQRIWTDSGTLVLVNGLPARRQDVISHTFLTSEAMKCLTLHLNGITPLINEPRPPVSTPSSHLMTQALETN